MSDSPIRVVIVDDEPLGRRRIEQLLARESGVEIAGQFGDGASAVEGIRGLKPDLVFLDVQMPKLSGLEVMKTLGDEMPVTIFVTAYDQHAVQAFDLAAVDYLVKPYDDERFETAFHRARRHLGLEEAHRLQDRLRAVLAGGDATSPAPQSAQPPKKFVERLPVESKGQVRLVPVSEVDAIVASGAYAEIVTAGARHLVRQTMQEIERSLDPDRFLRIHRSTIVAVDSVDSLLRGASGDLEVKLKTGARLTVARSRREEVERKLGLK
jgi:two-component system LytT family response regulator